MCIMSREWEETSKDQTRGFAVVALDSPKCEANVGGALRAAYCYNARLVVVASKRIIRMPTDTFVTHRHIPLLACPDVFDALPYDCVPVAVELIPGAATLPDYEHPHRAFYVFGGEDATLGARVLDRCRDVVMVPTSRCMNLAATVNVVLYDRLSKQISRKNRA